MPLPKYFNNYAEPEIKALNDFPDVVFDHVCCIPCFKENDAFITTLKNAAEASNKQVLLIVVINQPETLTHCDENQSLLNALSTNNLIWKNNEQFFLTRQNNLSILTIDRFSKPEWRMPKKHGVGLARKIACDCAAYLHYQGAIKSDFMHGSDADVSFPSDYFTQSLDNKSSAYIYPFTHSEDESCAISTATQLYEKSLTHYVEGLKSAGSPYAFHTIGSCITISIKHYIDARGFPKRPAGEDFYLLNKLNKLAPVTTLAEPVLTIQSRLSDRVPFGTGPAVEKLLNPTDKNLSEKIFYHPNCFLALKEWLFLLQTIAHSDKPDEILASTTNLNKELAELFNLAANMKKIFSNHHSEKAREKHLNDWFDAFRTMKLIHYLRDAHYPSLNPREIKAFSQPS